MPNLFLIVMAMPEEAQSIFADVDVRLVYTGLGKVNASYHLTKSLMQGPRPELVVNFGTAGSPVFPTHSLIECTRFVQRDMDLTPLGFEQGVTPFENGPKIIEVPKRFSDLQSGTCGTGDSFEVGKTKVECDVVDMEAYALAKICSFEKIPFLSVKYISDGSDHNAHNDWAANLPKAAEKFIEIFRRL